MQMEMNFSDNRSVLLDNFVKNFLGDMQFHVGISILLKSGLSGFR
jgi:hypothetical protein